MRRKGVFQGSLFFAELVVRERFRMFRYVSHLTLRCEDSSSTPACLLNVAFTPSKLITLEKLRLKYSAEHTFLTVLVNELQIAL